MGQEYDTPPEITSMREPVYPANAIENHIGGVVWVRVRVLEEGRVAPVIEVESGPAELQQSAVDAVRTALFLPAMLQGRPIAVWASIPVQYDLP